uniref:insulinase family protein n=1 Tax=Microbulbifer agarilyticus TaxID=260552 RepID=UPI0002557AFF|nr:insulinase family protein [Microbulbifer agarilyticus]
MRSNFLYTAVLALALLTSVSGCSKPTPESFSGPITKGKTFNDEREYEYLVLKNGLRVVAISDPEAEMSAAALDVAVGYTGDPADRAGMAHFLEHMLFMGSEKYPQPGAFRDYVSKHAGGTNAFTSAGNTRYFFTVRPENFESALDRWAPLFSAPLLDPTQIDKEKEAVDAEYKLSLKSDGRRIAQVEKLTANPAHPYNKFSTGNLDSLAARENGDLYAELRAFLHQHYHADNMVLAIADTRSIAEIKDLARQHFSDVPAQEVATVGDPSPQVPWLRPEDLGKKVLIKTLQENNSLQLQFPIPDTLANYPQRSEYYVSRVLSDKGRGGLFDQLKEKGWAHDLYAGPQDIDNWQDVFSITIALTETGAENTAEISAAIFDWLRTIREQGVQEWRFDEIRKRIELAQASAEPGGSMGAVMNTVATMLTANPEDILHWRYMIGEYNAADIEAFLGSLQPDNVRLVITGPEVSVDRYDALYDVHYQVAQIEPEELEQWRKAEGFASYSLPKRNTFSTDEQLVKGASEVAPYPVPVMQKPGFVLYHQQDNEFNVPKGDIAILIYSDVASNSLRHRALANLYSSLLRDSLQETVASAAKSGMRLYMDSNALGFSFGVSGYTEKQPELLRRAMKGIADFQIDPERFEVKKALFLQQWRDWEKSTPIQQVTIAARSVVQTRPFDRAGLTPEMESITVGELERYINRFFDEVSMEVLVYGNYLPIEAQQVGQKLYAQFIQGNKPAEKLRGGVKKLPRGVTLVELDIDHPDSAISIYYQGASAALEERASYALVAQVLRTSFFNALRTEQQMGYIAHASSATIGSRPAVPGLSFMIQSPKAGPLELERRIDNFLQNFSLQLQEMDDPTFEEHRAALLKILRRKDPSLLARSSRYWREILAESNSFDSREQLALVAEKLDREEVAALFKRQVLNADRRLIARSFGSDHRGEGFTLAQKDDSICRELPCIDTEIFSPVPAG